MNHTEIRKMAEFEKDYWWHRGKIYLVTTIIQKLFPGRTDLRILEIGCGSGGVTKMLKEYGTVVGVDISEEAARVSRENGVEVIVGDINELNLEASRGSFDLVLALDVLEHIQDDIKTMEIVRKLVKNSGYFFVNVPAHKFLWSEHDEALMHKRRYHSYELTHKLMDSGFSIVKKTYYVCTVFPLMAAYRMWGNLVGRSAYPKTSYVLLPSFLNSLMVGILRLEAAIAGAWQLPIGATLTVIAKPSDK